jgi:HK97 family phage major capsid protein
VTLRTVSRRRIEASKFSNFTLTWGTGEGTSISLFDTDSFISAFDTNIHPVTGAVLVGFDFMSDSPLNIGSILMNEWGKTFRKEMDDVIADGNGTDRPTGIFQTSGFTAVSSAGGAGAAPTVGDYEALYFDIPKQYRDRGRFIYLSTDVSYKRAIGIPVKSTYDDRRVFGMDHKKYEIFGNPYRVTQAAGVTNAEIAGVMIAYYRMYRRQGMEVRVISDDWQLARTNEEGLVVRARFGGQMEFGAAMTKITDGQA